jgi:hypothetical protein
LIALTLRWSLRPLKFEEAVADILRLTAVSKCFETLGFVKGIFPTFHLISTGYGRLGRAGPIMIACSMVFRIFGAL